jgi:SAM-dependent methyltransferase
MRITLFDYLDIKRHCSFPTQRKGKMKKILDACCGPRGFWFDKTHEDVLYVDYRELETVTGSGKDARTRKIQPDKIMDFRNLELRSNSFKMVVFDPPHLFLGKNSYMRTCYGSLSKETWRDDIEKGFSECFRVLENDGVLIFKWNESEILLKEILKLTPEKPLFGHPSGKAQKTHWVCFMKRLESSKNLDIK